MNYAEVVRIKYPDYVLTRVGTGNTYEELEWSAYNPVPNPIPKATLDADIASFAAQGVAGAPSVIDPSQIDELAALSALDDSNPGFIRKLGHMQYTLDATTYLSSITSGDVTTALGYSPYDSANPSNYTTKTYVDSLHTGNTVWVSPVHAFNFVGTASAPPTTANANENYIISAGGNVGAWAGFQVGDRVSYVGGTWVWREDAHIGCRLGICFDRTTTGVGDALGKDDYIGEIIGGDAINGWVWQWTAPEPSMAVFNNLTSSVKFGEAYTYVGDTNMWVPFASNTGVVDGSGLTYSTGSTLNVNTGKGIAIESDRVVAAVHPTGGIMTTDDGLTPSSSTTSTLALSTVGTPGTYQAVTVDAYGRVTAGTNPTTLSGFGILDAQPLDGDLTAIAELSGTSGVLRKTGTNTWTLDTTLGTGTFSPIITNPTSGQTLVYDGTNWINVGEQPSSPSGGGAAKRIWSSNIGSSTGTSVITPGTAAPLVTAGTQLWSNTITPLSTDSTYVVQSNIMVSGSNNGTFITLAVFRNNVFIGGTLQVVQSSSNSATLSFSITDKPTTTSPVTYQCRVGINSNTWYVNRRNSEITYGGQINTGWVMWEY